MFRSTQLAKLFPLSILMLLVIAIGSTGQSQSEKVPNKNQRPTTTRTESAPLVSERGSDARIDSKVMPPSDPVVVLLRLLVQPIDQKSGGAKQDQNSTRDEFPATSYEYADPAHFIFCGPDGISAEDFEALYVFFESPPPMNSTPPPPVRVEAINLDRRTSSKQKRINRQ